MTTSREKKTGSISTSVLHRLGADNIVKLMYTYEDWAIDNLDIIDYLIEQMNTKLITGEAQSYLNKDDYNKIVNFACQHIAAPFATHLIQQVGDYVSANLQLFSLEERNTILRSLMAVNYSSRVNTLATQQEEDGSKAVRRELNVNDRADIDLARSPIDCSYSLLMKDCNTRL